jgi:nucleoside-diphosphate-sugar epimerase
VEGARAILAWGDQVGAASSVLVYTSSTSVYSQGGGAVVDESAPLTGGDERVALLRDAERLAWAWPGGAAVLRLAGIYGPGRHHLLDALRRGEVSIGGRGDHRLNLIHRDDAATAILAALAHPAAARGQAFNVADDGAAPKSEVVRWLAARLDRAPPEFDPERVSARRAATPDRLISNQRIKAVLGWRPKFPSYREGYADLL